MKVLFVTWDGPQVTYLESLFLPIFEQLRGNGVDFHIMQFTWGDAERTTLARQACERIGFGYQAVSIWRRPLSVGSLATALVGARHIENAVQIRGINLVIARSILPALASMVALRRRQCLMVFDADGLPLDERVDFAGQLPSAPSHRFLRNVEAEAVRRAHVVLTRSSKAVEILHARAGAGTALEKFHVVINGRDATHFKPADQAENLQIRRELGLTIDTPLLVYAGSIGPQYCVGEMFRFFAYVQQRRPDAHLLLLTGTPEATELRLAHHRQSGKNVTIMTVPALTVARYLSCADLGLALRRRSFSMQAAAPIKLGEYLLSGLPVVATAGIGDTNQITSDVGQLLQDMDGPELEAAANWFIQSVLPQRERFRVRSRAVGLTRFSLEAGTGSYLRALRQTSQMV